MILASVTPPDQNLLAVDVAVADGSLVAVAHALYPADGSVTVEPLV